MTATLDRVRHNAQEAFLRQSLTHRVQAFFGGLQAGKSIAGADTLEALLYGYEINGERVFDGLRLPSQAGGISPEVWILSKSYTLADQAWGYFKWRNEWCVYTNEECRKLGLERGDSRTHWLRAGCDGRPIRLRVRTAHDPEQLRATGVLLAAWCDEIAHWPEMAWLNLQGRGIVTPTRYLITTTPKGKNWLYRDVYMPWKNATDERIGVVECRSIDNPWADGEYLEQLRKKFGAEYAAQELDALFTANVGFVYDFDRAIHMRELPSPDPEAYPIRVLGVDPGYGDPYAIGVWLRDAKGVWWMADEFYQMRRTTPDIIPWVKNVCERWKVQKAFVDKRRPADRDMLRKAHVPAQSNTDIYGEDDRRTVMPMIRICQRLFREGKIFVAPHCEWFAEEAENYAFPDREEQNAGENPVDFRNHHMDAMRYAICSVEGLPQDRRPRYRQPGKLENAPIERKRVWRIPSIDEQIKAQDERHEKQSAKTWTPVGH